MCFIRQGSLYAPFLYDAVYMHAKAIDLMRQSGMDHHDGRQLLHTAASVEFDGSSWSV